MPSGGPTWSLEDVLASRPAIRINQVGYLLGGSKHATLVTDAGDPVDFLVLNRPASRRTPDAASPGRNDRSPPPEWRVHRLDFSDLRTPGPGFRLVQRSYWSELTRSPSAPISTATWLRTPGSSSTCSARGARSTKRERPRLRPAGRSPGGPPQHRRHRSATLGRAGCGAAVPRLAGGPSVRRHGRLVRRRRPRQVRRPPRRAAHLAAAGDRRAASPTRSGPGRSSRRCWRRAAGSWIGCSGCNCPTATRHAGIGVPSSARHPPGSPTRSGRTSTRPPGCCTACPPAPRSPLAAVAAQAARVLPQSRPRLRPPPCSTPQLRGYPCGPR